MSYSNLGAKVVKCRTAHWCEWCSERINAGEMAHCQKRMFEGESKNHYMHPECAEDFCKVNQRAEGWLEVLRLRVRGGKP